MEQSSTPNFFDHYDSYMVRMKHAYVESLKCDFEFDFVSTVSYDICVSMLNQKLKMKYIQQMFEDHITLLKYQRDQ